MTSLEKRAEFTRKVIVHWKHKEKEHGLSFDELVFDVYNAAIEDALDAIQVYANRNPQHNLAFMSLKDDLGSWMPLVKIEEQEND